MSRATDPLEAVVADLNRRLRGPRAVRRALVTEVRDGLQDAAAGYEDAGLGPDQAAARAAAEFGRPAELAPLYQTELDASQGRRAALLIAVVYPTLTLLWDLLWRSPSTGGGWVPPGIANLSRLVDLGSYAAAVGAAIVIPLFGRAGPTLVRRLATAVAVGGWLTLAFTLSASAWMSLAHGGYGAREMMTSSLAGIAVLLATLAAAVAVARSATVTLLRVRHR